jgi:hypothetical protein
VPKNRGAALRRRRHYTDALLVAVVGLCTLENDVVHAAYLALALLLFRRRDALRLEGGRLFRWLPAYNFGVMLLTLLYQAPLEAVWGRPRGPRLARGPYLGMPATLAAPPACRAAVLA